MVHTAQARPSFPSSWLFGEAGGIQVWAAEGHPSVCVGVLIGEGPPVVILNRRLVGTPREHEAISWALAAVARGEAGFHVWRA